MAVKRKVSLPRVVEDAVQHSLDVDLVQLLHDLLEQLDVAETLCRSRSNRTCRSRACPREERREVHRVDAQLLEVLVVVANVRQSRHNLRLAVVHRGRAEVPQRENLVEDGVIRPLGEVRGVLARSTPTPRGLVVCVRASRRRGWRRHVRVIVGTVVLSIHTSRISCEECAAAGGDEDGPLPPCHCAGPSSDQPDRMTYLYWIKGAGRARSRHLPALRLDRAGISVAIVGRPVARRGRVRRRGRVIAEVRIAVDVEGARRRGSGGGAGIFCRPRWRRSTAPRPPLLRLGEFLCLSLRLGVLRQRLELGGGLGERRTLCGGLRGGGDRGGVHFYIGTVAGVARGDELGGAPPSDETRDGSRGVRRAGRDGRAGAARRGGGFGVSL